VYERRDRVRERGGGRTRELAAVVRLARAWGQSEGVHNQLKNTNVPNEQHNRYSFPPVLSDIIKQRPESNFFPFAVEDWEGGGGGEF
jgi:hypothetical protein